MTCEERPDLIHCFGRNTLCTDDILWRRLDVPGLDACRIERADSGWRLDGVAHFREGQTVCGISYEITHDQNWTTQSAKISGWIGQDSLNLRIRRTDSGDWFVNDALLECLGGCTDLDLGFTAATNTTAIRRLCLEPTQIADGVAAWLDTSDWRLKPLRQYYVKQSQHSYEYGSPAHGFQTLLTVNDAGLVTKYPDFWISARL